MHVLRLMEVFLFLTITLRVNAGDEQIKPFILEGKVIKVDDRYFDGCYHNAFEGKVEKLKDGKFKAGKQTISRTKGILYGAGTNHSKMNLKFNLEAKPTDNVKLVLNGIDDRFDVKNIITLKVNGEKIGNPFSFDNNSNITKGLNQRYFIGWQDQSFFLPAGLLKAGTNSLEIENTSSVFKADKWNYAIIDYVIFEFSGKAKMTIQIDEYPILYYGLLEGVEVNVWPAVNVDNKICLIKDAPLEYNFFATFPKEKPLGAEGSLAKEPTRPKREIFLHILSDADVKITDIQGSQLNQAKVSGGTEYTKGLGRIIKYSTPHPAQGVRVFITAKRDFENKMLTAWYSVDGKDYMKRKYPLRAVSLAPIKNRKNLKFFLSMWGGTAPTDSKQLSEYITLLCNAGFNQQFTGNNTYANKALKNAGFRVYPHFGWFGHKYKINEKNKAFASVSQKGVKMPRDFCPLEILKHKDDPELGKYYKLAEEIAKTPDVDGICVDYENPPVWCWCDKCINLFKKETGLKIDSRKDLIRGGKFEQEYRSFGRRRNRDLLIEVKKVIQSVNPNLDYHCLASASDLPYYWYDGRERGRHAIKELVKFADELYISHYCYELSGGLKSVIPEIETVKNFSLKEGRDVKTNIISPLATTVSEFPRYRGLTMKPDYLRLLILFAAAGGGNGISLFRGDCFDGEYYVSTHKTITELLKIEEYISKGINRSFELELTPLSAANKYLTTEVSQNLLSRMVWHPEISYYYDAVQLLKNNLGKERLILVGNYFAKDAKFKMKVRGLYDPKYQITDFMTGKKIGKFSRIELEGGKFEINVLARDCRFIKITTIDK